MNRHTDRPALPAPARIHATINGMRLSLPAKTQHLVGGWEDSAGPRTTEYVRADLADGVAAALNALMLVAVWDDDSDRPKFDAAYRAALLALAKFEGRS